MLVCRSPVLMQAMCVCACACERARAPEKRVRCTCRLKWRVSPIHRSRCIPCHVDMICHTLDASPPSPPPSPPLSNQLSLALSLSSRPSTSCPWQNWRIFIEFLTEC